MAGVINVIGFATLTSPSRKTTPNALNMWENVLNSVSGLLPCFSGPCVPPPPNIGESENLPTFYRTLDHLLA